MDISVVPTESIPLESAVARTLEGQTGVWNCHPSGTDPRCTVLCSSRTLPRYRPTRYGPPCSTRPPGPAINQHGRVCLVLSIQTNPTAHFASFSSLSLFCLFPLLPLSPPPVFSLARFNLTLILFILILILEFLGSLAPTTPQSCRSFCIYTSVLRQFPPSIEQAVALSWEAPISIRRIELYHERPRSLPAVNPLASSSFPSASSIRLFPFSWLCRRRKERA